MEKMRATWNGVDLAESSDCVIVEGNYYFPKNAIKGDYFKESTWHTNCHWKGLASYYHIEVAGETNRNAAWFYPKPLPAAAEIKDRVAFWNGVQVEKA
jgi:uncharacterized protein (DUF427 family)